MRKLNLILSVLLLTLFMKSADAQIRFMKGYFFDNEDRKTECYIRNADWMYNPSSFEWKENMESSGIQQRSISDVKEFVINDLVRYIRATVQIDRSSDADADDEMSNTSAPEWKEATVFLKVLVEGNATLYSYEEAGFIRYFYQLTGKPITQLVFKKYKTKGEPDFHYNEQFRQELFNNVNCNQQPVFNFETVSYNALPLMKVFIRHNKCAGGSVRSYKLSIGRKKFEVKPMLGVGFTGYSGAATGVGTPAGSVSYGNKTSPVYGLELEYYMPFLVNKWSAFLNFATLEYAGYAPGSGVLNKVDYATINITAGIRYGLYLSKSAKATLHLGVLKDIKISPYVYPVFGAGFTYKKISVDLSHTLYNSSGAFLQGHEGKLSNTAVTLKYAVFSF